MTWQDRNKRHTLVRILAGFKEKPLLTSEEVARFGDCSISTARGWMLNLQAYKLAEPCGSRSPVGVKGGTRSIVWRLTMNKNDDQPDGVRRHILKDDDE